MIGAQQGARSILHFAHVFRHAAEIGLFRNPEMAVARMRTVLALYGIE